MQHSLICLYKLYLEKQQKRRTCKWTEKVQARAARRNPGVFCCTAANLLLYFFLCVAKHAAKGYLLWPRCAVQSKQRPDVAWILALLLVYGFFKPLSSTVMEHLPSLLCIPGVICWFSSSLCANSFKNAKADSLTAELLRAKQKTLSTHTGVASDKVKCAINVYSHHFPPPVFALPSVLPLSQSMTV